MGIAMGMQRSRQERHCLKLKIKNLKKLFKLLKLAIIKYKERAEINCYKFYKNDNEKVEIPVL